MARYTERVRFTVPVEEKRRWQAKAASLGISLSELLRRATDESAAPGKASGQSK